MWSKYNRFFSTHGGGIKGDIVCTLRNMRYNLPNGQLLFDNLNLSFLNGAKIGILGPNGCGKSTLIKIIGDMGLDKYNLQGERWVKDGMKIGYLAQEPKLDETRNVYENIMDGLKDTQQLLDEFYRVSEAMGEDGADFDALLEKQSKLQNQIEHLDCWDFSYQVEIAMAALRVPDGASNVQTLSGGEKRRVALCRLLLEKPDMLLLDEPTNHLDAESVRWLENYLRDYKGTVVSITHDRYFLDNVAGWILELVRGMPHIYQGNYSFYLQEKQNRMDKESKSGKAKARNLKRELEWIQAHQGRLGTNKARLKKTNSKDTRGNEDRHKVDEGQITIPAGPRLGKKVIIAEQLSKSYDGRVLFQNLSFTIEPKSIIGIIGGNGSGKSTLVDILSGRTTPDTGTVTLGQTVQLGHVSQTRVELNDKNSVFEEAAGGNNVVTVNGQEINARAYVASFNLRGAAQEKRVSALSGGERNRLQLAKVLLHGHNVLILDEPTNDLDVETLRSLEMALLSFDGVVLVISHDRYFLDRISTHTMAFEGEGKVNYFEGNYSEYAAINNSK